MDRGLAMKNGNTTALIAVSLFLAGCQSVSYDRPTYVQPRPQGIEGQWVDTNGIISSFYNGRFETRTTDTNSLLAQGAYIQINQSLVEIDLTSLVRKTTSRVNCALASANQLNCTTSTGAQFTLARKTA